MHSLALDSVVGVHAEDSVMHVGDADGTVAMVDTDDRAADAEMMVDLGGLEDVVEGFFRTCFGALASVGFCVVTRTSEERISAVSQRVFYFESNLKFDVIFGCVIKKCVVFQ